MNDAQRLQRRHHVRQALHITKDTPLAPGLYERQLLARYVRGELTIEQVVCLVEEQQQPKGGQAS